MVSVTKFAWFLNRTERHLTEIALEDNRALRSVGNQVALEICEQTNAGENYFFLVAAAFFAERDRDAAERFAAARVA